MTREEAINRIEEHARYCVPCVSIGEFRAFGMAIDALRAQQTPAKLDRSRWEGCVVCNRCGVSGSNELFCNGAEAQYCPFCGRPLTEEAWAELERRINGGTANN